MSKFHKKCQSSPIKGWFHTAKKTKRRDKVNIPIKQGFDIGTLVTNLSNNQLKDKNITKAKVKWINKYKLGIAEDFFKFSLDTDFENIYHHVGIYSFRFESLKKFVNLSKSINEIERQLEQMRALDSKMTIGVTYAKDIPISVDTIDDLKKIENLIKNKWQIKLNPFHFRV